MKKPRFLNVWLFFASVYLLSFLLYVPILVSGQGISTPLNKALMAAVTFVPSVMGVLLVHLTKAPEEVRDFWRRAYRWPRGRTKIRRSPGYSSRRSSPSPRSCSRPIWPVQGIP